MIDGGGAPPRHCPTCGGADAETALRVRGSGTLAVLRCRACGLLYTSPERPAESYGDAYYAAASPLGSLLRGALLRERLSALSGIIPGRLLDVGCGTGDFLRLLKSRGWDVAGLETSGEARARASEAGIEVSGGELEDAHWAPASFDAVTFWHVLEHLPRPTAALARARELLADRGVLIVEVPNASSPAFRLFGERWYHCDVPRHLQHFTPATLGDLLSRAGFDVVRRSDLHWFDLASIGMTAAGRPTSALRLAGGALASIAAAPAWLLFSAAGRGETMTVLARKR
jgi:SAM-dependent methyltransferase